MAVSVSNLVIDQNSDFDTTVLLQDASGNPLDLSGAGTTFIGRIKKYYGSNTFVNIQVTILSPLNNGQIRLFLDKNTTKYMDIGRYVYDVKYIDSNNVAKKVLEGIVTVNGGIS